MADVQARYRCGHGAPSCQTWTLPDRIGQTITGARISDCRVWEAISKLVFFASIGQYRLATPRAEMSMKIAIVGAGIGGCEFRRNPATDSDLKPATVPI